jgi:hypothetical protein
MVSTAVAASMVVAGFTVAGRPSTGVVGTDMMTDSAVAANSMVEADGMVKDSAVALRFAAGVDSIVSHLRMEGASSTVGAASMVAAGPTEEAAGSCSSILLSHSNGWQPKLPAVSYFHSLKFWQKGKTFNTENAEEHKEDLQVSRAYTVTAIVANFECSHLSPANCNLPPETRHLARTI